MTVVEAYFGTSAAASDQIGLAAAFRLVAEAECQGHAKFGRHTCRLLGCVIAGRSYAKRLTELCHLVVAAAATDRCRRYEALFWASGTATPANFQAHFEYSFIDSERLPSVRISAQAVELDYNDGVYAIAYGRMPLLSALAEFLVTVLGYAEVDRLLAPLLADGIGKRDAEIAGNALARKVHAYLADKVSTGQHLKKFRLMSAYLGRRDGGGATPEGIDDDAVLGFWLENSTAPGADAIGFKTYRSVFKSFVKLRDVLAEARDRYRLDHPRALGPDAEAGEIDPERISESLEVVHDPSDPLAALAESPADTVKFFNSREIRELGPLISHSDAVSRLCLSFLRSAVFGDAQARIVGAGRLDDGAHGDYEERIDRYRRLLTHCRRVMLASLDVLIRLRRVESVLLVAALEPDIELGASRESLSREISDEAIVSISGVAAARELVEALARRPGDLGPDVARLVAEARSAYRSIARRGFRDEDAENAETGDGFAVAVEPLERIGESVRGFIDAIETSSADWRRQFDLDRDIFYGQFHLIHGERDDEAAE